MNELSWFDLNFPWIGGVGALVLLALLFGTNLLRSDLATSRWRDLTWLSWLGAMAYLIHNIEEYGIDMFGRVSGFPQDINRIMNLPPYPDSPIDPLFFVSVNVTAFWIAAPLAALLSRRHPLVGLFVHSIILVNIVFHVMPLIAGAGYSAGTHSAIVLFIPLSVWVIYAGFARGPLQWGGLGVMIGASVLFHALLSGPIALFLNGIISSTVMVLIQIVNPFLLMFILWLGEKWRGGALINSAIAKA